MTGLNCTQDTSWGSRRMTETAEVAQDHRVHHRSVGFSVPCSQHHEGNPPRNCCSDPQYAASMCVDEKKQTSLQKRKKSHLEQPYSMVSEEVTRIYDLLITALHKTCLTV